MAEPDFRALCAKLLQGLDENRHEEVRYPGHLRLVMADAREALARSSPAPAFPKEWHKDSLEVQDALDSISVYKNPSPSTPTRDELNDACGPGPTVEPAFTPIPVSERLPGPEDCCGNPRNGRGEWCWGRQRPGTPAGTPVIWRLMMRECLVDEAIEWAPWWALPIPTTQED
jgi:hypothetical protein